MIGMILGVAYLYTLAAICYWLSNKLSPSKNMWEADSLWSFIFAILYIFLLCLPVCLLFQWLLQHLLQLFLFQFKKG